MMFLAAACALSQALSRVLVGGGLGEVQTQGNGILEYLLGLVWPLVLGLAGAGMMAYGKQLAQGEKESILRFLQETLDAQAYEGEEVA
jgi:hypothetical protein